MRLKTFLAVLVFMAFSIVPAFASSTTVINVKVPFAFEVDHTVLPAANYQLRRVHMETDNIWMIRSKDGRHSAEFVTNPEDTPNPVKRSTLEFEKVGDIYYLSNIWVKGNEMNWWVPQDPDRGPSLGKVSVGADNS